MLSRASASTMSKASFVVMAAPADGYSARGTLGLRSSRTAATVASAIAKICVSSQSLTQELSYGIVLHHAHRSPFDCFRANVRIRASSRAWLPDFTCHLPTAKLTTLAYEPSRPRH